MGTQVRMHVVRLYGMEFERPGPRLRDYVRRVQGALAAALRACRMLTESEVEEPAATDVFHGLVAAAAQLSRPVISFKSRAGTAIRRSAARSVVSGPDCDTDRRCVRRSGFGRQGRSGRCRCRSRRRFAPVAAGTPADHHRPDRAHHLGMRWPTTRSGGVDLAGHRLGVRGGGTTTFFGRAG